MRWRETGSEFERLAPSLPLINACLSLTVMYTEADAVWAEFGREGGREGYGGFLVVRVGMSHANSFPMQHDMEKAVDQFSLMPS